MNDIKLYDFLKKIQSETNDMDNNELTNFISDIGLELGANKRSLFLERLEKYKNGDHDNVDSKFNKIKNEIQKEVADTIVILNKIKNQEFKLDSEYDLDNYYNRNSHYYSYDDDDDFVFHDHDNILCSIEYAVDLIEKCFDLNLMNEGFELSKIICYLDVEVDGYYNECCCSSMTISDLIRYELINTDFKDLIIKCLYFIYNCTELNKRTYVLYAIFERFNITNFGLEEVFKLSGNNFDDFDEFINNWIEYLVSKKDYFTENLIKEAQTMLRDDYALLNNARKYVTDHPYLYLQILEMNKDEDANEKMLDIGLEALEKVKDDSGIRCSIALNSADYANRICDYNNRDYCWMEAFSAEPSVLNYMRIKFLSHDKSKYSNIILRNIDDKKINNSIDKGERNIMLFFEKKFNDIKNNDYSINALRLLLINSNNRNTQGMKAILTKAYQACEFNGKELYRENYEQQDDYELFMNIFNNWKNTVKLQENDVKQMMKKIESSISDMTEKVLTNKQRSCYEACAAYIAAYGETKEAMGCACAKQEIMCSYKNKYKYFKAFHRSLVDFGMLK